MISSFKQLNLNSHIFKAVELCGYKEPTPIQSRSIPDILNGKDLVASAPTGTGKTAAFVLPALNRLIEAKGGTKPRVLILTPTRELATQIMDTIGRYGKFMRLNTVNLVGGMPYRQQIRGLSRALDIVVATPGRLLDHMQAGRVKLSEIEMLILDEADRMLDMGFIDDVKMIAKATPQKRQTLLFSATVDKKLDNIIKQLLNNPIRIDLSAAKMAPVKIKQEIYMADNTQHKNKLLQHFLRDGNIFKAIIFSATKINADRLAKQLHDEGHSVAALHGDLKQAVRNRTIEAMRRGKIQFLIATDVAARGIDIDDITHVINFDLPRFHEDYVHRIGRTGRAGRSGTAISFVLPDDGRHLQGIERYIGEKIAFNTVEGLEAKQNFNANPQKKKRGRRASGKPSHFSKDNKSYKKQEKDARGHEKTFRKETLARKEGFSKKENYSRKEINKSYNKREKDASGLANGRVHEKAFRKETSPRKESRKDGFSRKESFSRSENGKGRSQKREGFKGKGKKW